MKISICCLAVLVLFLATSCSKKSSNAALFPFSIGNQWKYQYAVSVSPDSLNYSFAKLNIAWTVLKDTTVNGINTIQLLAEDTDSYSGKVNRQYSYYISNSDGLYLFGSDTPAMVGPIFMRIAKPQSFSASSQQNLKAGIVITNPTIRLLKFPIVIGEIWESKNFGASFTFKRKYLDTENVTTAAGTFQCTKLEEFLDSNNDGIPDSNSSITYEWYDSKGFVMSADTSTGVSNTGVPDIVFTSITLESLNVQ